MKYEHYETIRKQQTEVEQPSPQMAVTVNTKSQACFGVWLTSYFSIKEILS